MEELLLQIGSVVKANISNEEKPCMIIGHRIINPFSMRAWDYVAVEHPKGLSRRFKEDRSLDHDEFFYFNHPDILAVLKKAESVDREGDINAKENKEGKNN